MGAQAVEAGCKVTLWLPWAVRSSGARWAVWTV